MISTPMFLISIYCPESSKTIRSCFELQMYLHFSCKPFLKSLVVNILVHLIHYGAKLGFFLPYLIYKVKMSFPPTFVNNSFINES